MRNLRNLGFCYGQNMMWLHRRKHPRLAQLLRSALPIQLNESSKIVILSDLHMGDGSRFDEFRTNAELVYTMLHNYYHPRHFSLVLNGDIEELLKFPLYAIETQWNEFYPLFRSFQHNGFFWKTWGNHDAPLLDEKEYQLSDYLLESLKFHYKEESLLLFHGHQASVFMWETFPMVSHLAVLILRYLAKPTGIKNFSVAHNSRRRFAVEKAIYEFSNREKIVSIIGHTHRPLFESLSKLDFLNYKIEDLCRHYPTTIGEERSTVRQQMQTMKKELEACYQQGKKIGLRSGIYHTLTIPSLFNSGCTIGKRGITALEIEGNTIRLVGWYNSKEQPRFATNHNQTPHQLASTNYYRTILNEEPLDYIFSRLHLLA